MEEPLPSAAIKTNGGHDGSSLSLHMKDQHDDHVHDDDMSSTENNDYEQSSEDDHLVIAESETRWIQWSKFLVASVLLTGAGLSAYYAFSFTSSQEQEEFNSQFDSIGNVIIDVGQITADSVFDTIKSMSTTITSFAVATNATWPFVTIPNYGARGSQLLKLSGSFYLSFSPIVEPHLREEWERYSVEHQGWLLDELIAGGGGGGGPPPAEGEDPPSDGAGGPPPPDRRTRRQTRRKRRGLQEPQGPPTEEEQQAPPAEGDGIGEGGTPPDGPPPGGAPGPGILPFIWQNDLATGEVTPVVPRNVSYGPFWQVAPPFPFIVNQDIFSLPNFDKIYDAILKTKDTVLSDQFRERAYPLDDPRGWPISYITSPIFETLMPTGSNNKVVALFSAVLPWHEYFKNTVPAGLGGLHVVIRNSCDQSFTYVADGESVTLVALDDAHETRFDDMEITDRFDILSDQQVVADSSTTSNITTTGTCKYSISVYPTKEFHEHYVTDTPIYYTAAVILIFSLTSLVFILYDCLVKRKDKKVMTSATNTNAIVNSLFPATVRDRLMDDAILRRGRTAAGRTSGAAAGNGGGDAQQTEEDQKALLLKSKPIADLFPNATVMFADINGFTAWASSREPSQVFTLLEQIYGSFDIIAKAKGVFKVETTGDCYVAAAGLPEARPDHAVVMARFARDCLNEMNNNVNSLEILLGPDTAELSMRFGLHSGPVTGGVLRGDKSRFQLFGDTVNMASRIESTGMRNRIHVSQETANCLIEQGKGAWLTPRKETIFAKGKGDIQTYWVDCVRVNSNSNSQRSLKSFSSSEMRLSGNKHPKREARQSNAKVERLIEWNVTVLQGLLKKIVAMRPPESTTSQKRSARKLQKEEPKLERNNNDNANEGFTVLNEVKEIIELPGKAAAYIQDPDAIELDPKVIAELREYVRAISNMYRDNPFHSFEHASHVVQSVTKLLSRVVTPDAIDYKDLSYVKKKQKTVQLHEYTYGITSDPLTQFACAFSALIHDVDHVGIPNVALIKEDEAIAKKYNHQSVAEQNSVDLAWAVLEGENFIHLRRTIYSTEAELCRFRQLVVNSVMATDIADKELGALRKKRWNKAFNLDDQSMTTTTSPEEDVNRKATIVIEHLIQASDVSHTMQHWHVYLKWNERLFREMYKAYLAGRLENDPSTGWYKGEIGFFDFYLIPLGKKLKECGVFGVSSDEYLNYAVANRKEWELKGEEVVARYLASFHESTLNSSTILEE